MEGASPNKETKIWLIILAFLVVSAIILGVIRPEAFLAAVLIILFPFFLLALMLGRRGLAAIIISMMALALLSSLLKGDEEWRWRRLRG
jgi:cellulose synthase/poly-beta-1,6-N-acetylglucosamine synthase-like glycosyltransferase